MSFSHTKTTFYTTGEGQLANTANIVTGDGEIGYDGSIAATIEAEVDIAFAFANVKSFLISSTQGATIKSNSSGTPGAGTPLTIPTGGGALAWNLNDIEVCPFAADVTKLYITNNHATLAATVKVRVLLDVTP
jgi:hypothetical protein